MRKAITMYKDLLFITGKVVMLITNQKHFICIKDKVKFNYTIHILIITKTKTKEHNRNRRYNMYMITYKHFVKTKKTKIYY